MSNSIQQLELNAANAVSTGQFNEAIEIYSRIIQLATNTFNAYDTSLVFVRRAGYCILAKRYEESLVDSEIAIGLDSNNILAYSQKAALLHLNKVNEAKAVIQFAKELPGDHQLLEELEDIINNSWLTLRIVAVSLCLGLLFIHLRRLYQFFIHILHVFLHAGRQFLYRIWLRLRAIRFSTSSSILSAEVGIAYDADAQSISTRF
ncbi:unnamed protein product [Rotaria sordida]|uniref:Uncharacterized protein n=1 Tax=Rotaria sordida TaxID=392033 RepID=A0A814ZM46_9BILA|nr:unnamed protein product [Rotaria sordida]